MSTKITDLRGSMVRPIHRGSVLFSKQEDLCSTSYYVEPAVNRQPGFRRELVEQKPTISIRQFRNSFIQMHTIDNFQMKSNFLKKSGNVQKNIIFQHFSKQMRP